MPSVPAAGLLVFRRGGGVPVEVLLLAPAAGRSPGRARGGPSGPAAARRQRLGDEVAARRGVRVPRGAHRVPSWTHEANADGGAATAGSARPSGTVAAAELSLEERLRRRPRRHTPANEELLDTARRGFAADFGLQLGPPFLFLGGVKQHHHRLLYVWAREVDAAAVETIAGRVGDPRAVVFVDLDAAREIVVSPQRRFIDQLAALVSAEDSSDT